MVIRETQRTYTYLNLYDYATDAILVNRIFPEAVQDPYFKIWKERQQQNMEFISEAFGTLPVYKAPLFGEEMGGLEMLRRLADELFGDQNPAERLFDGVVHKIQQLDDDNWVLRVPIGFAKREDLDLYRSRDEISLSVGPYRRNIVLPDELQSLEITSAKFEDQYLNIKFEKQNSG
jgi:arsenite-transporting ATPase